MRPKHSKAGGLSPVYLIVDSREGAVVPFLDDALSVHAHLVKQVTVGDYLVCRADPGKTAILACIERKTLPDFAASICDRRYETEVGGMLRLREECGCQLFFVVEGPAYPSPNRKFARIPYSSILSAITNLMVRDKIYVVQTENEAHTAKRLAELMWSYHAHPDGGDAPCSENLPQESVAALGPDREHGNSPARLDVPEILTRRVEPTESGIAVDMWARLNGVSIVLGKVLTQKMSVSDLAGGWVEPAQLRELKTLNGKTFGKSAIVSLLAIREGAEEPALKLVSGIRGMSVSVAKDVLNSMKTLKALCQASPGRLAQIMVTQKNRTVRLGPVKAKKLLSALQYKDPATASLVRGVTCGSATKTRPILPILGISSCASLPILEVGALKMQSASKIHNAPVLCLRGVGDAAQPQAPVMAPMEPPSHAGTSADSPELYDGLDEILFTVYEGMP